MIVERHATRVIASIDVIAAQGSELALPGHLPDRFRIGWALLRASLDHATAIAVLLSRHDGALAGSACALLRPMNEAFKRGTWFLLCASEAETEAFLREDTMPRRNLAADIERIPPFDRFPIFSAQYANAWERFHSYTHGGRALVAAYTQGDAIGIGLPDEELLRLLDHVEAIALNGVHVMAAVCGEFDRATAERVLDALDALTPAREQPA